MTNNISNTQEDLAYQSYPYQVTGPENLRTMGVLFGMNPPDVKGSKVLEIGCADGANLIPHAVRNPKASFIGVDSSKVKIESGLGHIKALGLKNIELKHCGITDIDKSFGKFDYIISHGIISSVSEAMREKILEISSKNLTENGIAYVSYNTLPGWNMVKTIRDMMSYHAKNFATAQEKVIQGRMLLEFIKESLEGQDTPYANILRLEAELLANQSDYHLKRDYLEEENKQFYFSEFMDSATKHGLQYLSDCSLPSMYLGNMPQNAAEKLQAIDDIVRAEQYMDFITNRRFRNTLLCHSSVKLNRALNNEDIKKFTMTMNVIPEKRLTDIDINDDSSIQFFLNNNKDNNIASVAPTLKAIFYTFVENVNNPLSFDEIVKKAASKLKGDKKAAIEKDFIDNAMSLVIKGYINLSLESGNRDKVKTDKPKLSDYTIYQATKTGNNWVTNHSHAIVVLSIPDKFAIQYINGKHERGQIVEFLVEDVKNGKMTLNKDDQKIENEKEIKEALGMFYDDLIERLSIASLLI